VPKAYRDTLFDIVERTPLKGIRVNNYIVYDTLASHLGYIVSRHHRLCRGIDAEYIERIKAWVEALAVYGATIKNKRLFYVLDDSRFFVVFRKTSDVHKTYTIPVCLPRSESGWGMPSEATFRDVHAYVRLLTGLLGTEDVGEISLILANDVDSF